MIVKQRRILVFTGTRAEYGLLRPVLNELIKFQIEPHLLISGTHLDQAYGATVSELSQSDSIQYHYAPIDLSDNTPLGVCHSMGEAIIKYADIIQKVSPDLVVVLGDRYETLCMATASVTSGVPLAHLHGGETTLGAIDEAYRHAITKMAQLHFTSCEEHRKRVIQMGENPKNVWNVGALGVENIQKNSLMPPNNIRKELNIPKDAQYIVATYHPVTKEKCTEESQINHILSALEKFPNIYVIFTGANADAGGNKINSILQKRAATHTRFKFFMSLGVYRYHSASRYALGVLGNSSSGIIEIPSLGVPVLDIGERQKGRYRSSAVIHCETDIESITRGIHTILQPETAKLAKTTSNPYDKRGSAQNIAHTLSTYPLDKILKSRFYDWNFTFSETD